MSYCLVEVLPDPYVKLAIEQSVFTTSTYTEIKFKDHRLKQGSWIYLKSSYCVHQCWFHKFLVDWDLQDLKLKKRRSNILKQGMKLHLQLELTLQLSLRHL